MSAKSGKIITFYSYKGGTGRTMAISNVAWILASNGYNVLLIDWDLEAPGLHRYLRPFLVDPELTHTRGLIDFVWDAARMNMTQVQGNLALKIADLKEYVVGLDWTFRGNGSISFLPAGQQDENYAHRVNTFNWDNFYERLGGGKLLEAERDNLRANYDYILIDSRTGVSDTSSICTVQMPDLLVVLFTLNRQSINGAVAVAESIQAQRGQSFPIYPVPTRIEHAETDKLASAIAYARSKFAPFLIHVDPVLRASYWRDVETPYVSFYAFEEVPAAFKEESGSRRGLLAPNESIASWITNGIVSSLQPEDEKVRKDIVDAYAFRKDEVSKPVPPPNRYGPLGYLLEKVRWQLRRRPCQYATIAVASVAALLAVAWVSGLGSTYMSLSKPIAGINSQLTAVLEDLQKIQAVASESTGSANFPKAKFSEAYAKLLGIQESLNNLQATIRSSPTSAGQNRPSRQAPPIPQRQ